MATTWQAIVASLVEQGDHYEAKVMLAGDDKFDQSYQTDGTLANLRAQVLATIARREARLGKTELFPGLAIDTTPDVVAPPTTPNLPRVAWLQAYRDLQRLDRGAAYGLVETKRVSDQLALVQSTFLPDYEDLL